MNLDDGIDPRLVVDLPNGKRATADQDGFFRCFGGGYACATCGCLVAQELRAVHREKCRIAPLAAPPTVPEPAPLKSAP